MRVRVGRVGSRVGVPAVGCGALDYVARMTGMTRTSRGCDIDIVRLADQWSGLGAEREQLAHGAGAVPHKPGLYRFAEVFEPGLPS